MKWLSDQELQLRLFPGFLIRFPGRKTGIIGSLTEILKQLLLHSPNSYLYMLSLEQSTSKERHVEDQLHP